MLNTEEECCKVSLNKRITLEKEQSGQFKLQHGRAPFCNISK
jgi:hypothetical protein